MTSWVVTIEQPQRVPPLLFGCDQEKLAHVVLALSAFIQLCETYGPASYPPFVITIRPARG